MTHEYLALQELVELRRFLQEFCRDHVDSMMQFALVPAGQPLPDLGKWGFKEYYGEGELAQSMVLEQDTTASGASVPPGGTLRHPTTTATCIESLFDCPDEFWPAAQPKLYDGWKEVAADFYTTIIESGRLDAKDRRASFCAMRALPVMMRSASLKDSDFDALQKQVSAVVASATSRGHSAFQAFWTLRMLRVFRRPHEAKGPGVKPPFQTEWTNLIDWCRSHLVSQISLHKSDAESADTDELGWSLAAFLRFEDQVQRPPAREWLEQGLECFFSKQLPSGAWRSTRPVFNRVDHAPAYSYSYELMTCLLKAGLSPDAVVIREAFLRYAKQLRLFAHHARETRVPIDSDDGTQHGVGWLSDHPSQPAVEAWATACVFQFAQSLRKLCAIWTSEASLRILQRARRPSSPANPATAYETFKARGQTWRIPGKNYEVRKGECLERLNVHEQLTTLFVNQIRFQDHLKARDVPRRLDPDDRCIDERQARSAILFGPPGASKSSLVEQLAAIVNWKFVEIHSSDFVRDGLQLVHRTADEIFERLLDLDHAVVLLDEIDELVRERADDTGMEGRFLTTSMLPKLAELWKHRRIIFFVATNHVEYFDAAIRRTGRFDAVLYSPTSAFEPKLERLVGLLKKDPAGYSIACEERLRELVASALGRARNLIYDSRETLADRAGTGGGSVPSGGPFDRDFLLARFALLRFDQIPELALEVGMEFAEAGIKPGAKADLTVDRLTNALGQLRDSGLSSRATYEEFFAGHSLETFDYGMQRLWNVSTKGQEVLDRLANDPSVERSFVRGPRALQAAAQGNGTEGTDWYFRTVKQMTRKKVALQLSSGKTLTISRMKEDHCIVDVAESE